ncbi:hypothetical protein RND71_007460 [Anisodus tanguticus]|uniref:Calcineurin-like phosphoesterase domain-containing protein n=1 Tax=Anisodus tanguticus TaxID=243964 RepID=A0AAE1SM05_9SOLA|nr:hypothetical protein RND71_007460 [Anisodus tanguticus]
MADEVSAGNVDSVFHIGDISYATRFLVEWDYFLHLITPVASHVSYMTAIGNHERDYIGFGSVYVTPDSGGECGVPYETYFQMPTPAKDKPWHRPMYSSITGGILKSVDDDFVKAVEPLLLANKVDLALWGHVHNYERTCAVYQKECKVLPTNGASGIDTYDHANYSASVHAVIGMAGFSLDQFPSQYVNANSRKLEDSFQITRS